MLVSYFQPFQSRVGTDKVISLAFPYDDKVVEKLKIGIKMLSEVSGQKNLGGWLPDQKCWFVEPQAWRPLYFWLLLVGVDVQWNGDKDWMKATACKIPEIESGWHIAMLMAEGLRYYK